MTKETLETIVAADNQRLTDLQGQYYADRKKLNGTLERLANKIDCLEEKMNRRLPLWATFLITVLCSAVVGLLVTIVG